MDRSSESQTLELVQVSLGGAIASVLRDLVSCSLCHLVSWTPWISAVQEEIPPVHPCILPTTNDMCGLCLDGRAEGGHSLVL